MEWIKWNNVKLQGERLNSVVFYNFTTTKRDKMHIQPAPSAAKPSKDETVQTGLPVRICKALNCGTSDIMEIDCNERECNK